MKSTTCNIIKATHDGAKKRPDIVTRRALA
jgi:hypothetical protein